MDSSKEYIYRKAKKQPKKRYRCRTEFDFLKYIRIAFKWALETTGLRRGEIEVLLYAYGHGYFTRKEFTDYYSLHSIYQRHNFKLLIKDGWIKLYRDAKLERDKLYVVTHKTKGFCNSMHKYCAGLQDFPKFKKSYMENRPVKLKYYNMAIAKANKDKVDDN